MAIYAFYHKGRLIPTYDIIKADNPLDANEQFKELIKDPAFDQIKIEDVLFFELDACDCQEKSIRQSFHKINVLLIQSWHL